MTNHPMIIIAWWVVYGPTPSGPRPGKLRSHLEDHPWLVSPPFLGSSKVERRSMANPLQYITILWAKAMWICSPCVVILNSALATEPERAVPAIFGPLEAGLKWGRRPSGQMVSGWKTSEANNSTSLPAIAGVLQQIFEILLENSGWTLTQGAWHGINHGSTCMHNFIWQMNISDNPFDIKVSTYALQLCLYRNITLRIPGC